MRAFFAGEDYLEVETPIRIPAPAPEEHIDAPTTGEWFLHTSPELGMKRLLAAGFEKIYQICHCFRSGERGRRHLPEMTLLEWYTVHADYQQMMVQCERLICHVFKSLGRDRLVYRGQPVDLDPPWERLTVAAAFERYGSLSLGEALENDRFDEILGLEIEPHLGLRRPVFLYDYPVACGALARRKAGAPLLAERFELYICGLELCNAFSELNDPVEQRDRFLKTLARRETAGKERYPLPERFLAALADMPPAAGNALGVDRLVMLASDCDRIDDVVTFVPEEL
jgi:lysyl-tRNA synthetase class 2